MIREVTEKNSSQFLQLEHHQDSQSYLRASWSWVWHEIIKGNLFLLFFFLSFLFFLWGVPWLPVLFGMRILMMLQQQLMAKSNSDSTIYISEVWMIVPTKSIKKEGEGEKKQRNQSPLIFFLMFLRVFFFFSSLFPEDHTDQIETQVIQSFLFS